MVTKKKKAVKKVVKKVVKQTVKKAGVNGAKKPSPRRVLTEILVGNNKTKYTDRKICDLMVKQCRNRIYRRPSYIKWLRKQINAGKIKHAKVNGKIHEVKDPNAKPAKPAKAAKKVAKKPIKAKAKPKAKAKKTAKKAVKAKA